MKLFVDLFTTDFGLLSAAVIAFMLVMAVFFIILFTKKTGMHPGE